MITSKNNPLVKETASLKDKKGRKALGSFLVEGHKMSIECLGSPLQIERVFLTHSYAETYGSLFPEEICVYDDVFRHLSDEKTPQGVLCRVKIPAQTVEKPTEKCLLLDGVSDPGNMGAIIRTANAAGYRKLYLTDDCTDPFSPKSVRASMSGVFSVEIYIVSRDDLAQLLDEFPVLVADMAGENAFQATPPKAYALAIGNEGKGLSQTIRNLATQTVSIPMKGGQESLNAAVAAGIVMYLLSKDEFSAE